MLTLILQNLVLPELAPSHRLIGGCRSFIGPFPLLLWMKEIQWYEIWIVAYNSTSFIKMQAVARTLPQPIFRQTPTSQLARRIKIRLILK